MDTWLYFTLLTLASSSFCLKRVLFKKSVCSNESLTVALKLLNSCASGCVQNSDCYGFGITLGGICQDFLSLQNATCSSRNDWLIVYTQILRIPVTCLKGGIPNADETACICPGHRFGRFCQSPACWKTGEPYKGMQNFTKSGKICQRWDVQSPHVHEYNVSEKFPDTTVEEAANFCRNLDHVEAPWCYTTDPGMRWELCEIEHCEPCSYTGEYTGSQNLTRSGIPCQRWDQQTPHSHEYTAADFPDATVSDAANYWRILDDEEPWCYTTNPDHRWEFCGISPCN